MSTSCTHGVISKAKLRAPSDSASQVHVPENFYHEWWACCNKHNVKKSYTWAWVWLSWHGWHRGHCPQTRWPKMPLQLPEHLSMIVWVELKLFLLEGTWWRWTGTSGPWLSKAIERFHEWRVKMASGGIKGFISSIWDIGKVTHTQTHSCLPLEWEDRYFSDIAESPSELWCLAYTSFYQGSLECQPLFDF